MANENRINQAMVEVMTSTSTAQGRISSAHAEVVLSAPDSVAAVKFNQTESEVIITAPGTIALPRFSQAMVEVIVSSVTLIKVAPLENPTDPLFGVAGWEVGGVSDEPIPKLTAANVERNPFSATLPTEQQELRFALEEQQKILREQHNITQAGDTTFDFGLLLLPYAHREFNLGSLGRFFHPEFGIIEARFCKLEGFVDSLYQGCPVGWVKKSSRVDWRVTNDFAKSGTELAAGVCYFTSKPADGYGWVVTSGASLSVMSVRAEDTLVRGDSLGWAGPELLAKNINGPQIARVWATGKSKFSIPEGGLYIQSEPLSTGSVIHLLNQAKAEIQEIVDGFDVRVGTAETSIGLAEAGIAALNSGIAQLTTRLTREENTRNRQFEALSANSAQADWHPVISAGDRVVREEYRAADLEIRREIRRLSEVAAFNPAGLQSQIDAIYRLIGQSDATLPPPTSAGQMLRVKEIPGDPTSLTPTPSYEYELVDPIMSHLTDVDLSVAPTSGQILKWNVAAAKWKPGNDESGGGGGGGGGWTKISSWSFAVDGAAAYAPVGDLTGKNEVYVVCTNVTLADVGWRGVQFSSDGGVTWPIPANWGDAISNGTQNLPYTAGDLLWYLHSTSTSQIRTAAGTMWGLQAKGPKMYRTARNPSGMLFTDQAFNAIRVGGITGATLPPALMTGGSVEIWAC